MKKRIFWTLLLLVMASAVWALKVEVTYEHNVRHIPTDYRQRHHLTIVWKA
jgi:hypothetical protein